MQVRTIAWIFLFLTKGIILSTELKEFPSHIQISTNDYIYLLDKTGSAEKEGLYTIAHYLQRANEAHEIVIYVQIFTDGDAKELLIDWEKNLTCEEIQEEFRECFAKALTNSELQEHKNHIEEFLLFFDQDVKALDHMKIIWLKDGDLRVFLGQNQMGAIMSVPFAKAVWKIWLGTSSVVERSLLVDDFIDIENRD